MCGIIGCITESSADNYLLPALSALEYRGYDSVGVAICTENGSVATLRSVSRIDDLREKVTEWAGPTLMGTGIGHTRWATHGDVTEANAHPHSDCDGLVSVVHNGIIDNADTLRAELITGGHRFTSAVDSEVICHLVENGLLRHGDIAVAVCEAVAVLEGSWALVVMESATGRMFASTHRAPLLVANSDHGLFVASDVTALAPWINQFRVMGDGDFVELSSPLSWQTNGVTVLPPEPMGLSYSWSVPDYDLAGDFMGREIAEQPETADRILGELADRVADGSLWRETGLPDFHRVAIIGCGTSLNAGRVIGTAFSAFGGVPHIPIVASESAETILEPDTLILAASQSGETADVLRALDVFEASGCPVLALTNSLHSTLARRADGVLNCFAGTEIGVAATKTFVAQVMTGVCLALSALAASGKMSRSQASAIVDDLRRTPERLARALEVSNRTIPDIVDELVAAEGFLFLGRGAGVIYAAEGALKLKELTYRWAEHYPAGELKHGPLALVHDGTPVIVIDNGDPRLAGSMSEVRARGGVVIRIGAEGSTIPAVSSLADPFSGAERSQRQGFTPCGPLESVVPLQVLARELALALGHDVDKPRNLAKSVTVE